MADQNDGSPRSNNFVASLRRGWLEQIANGPWSSVIYTDQQRNDARRELSQMDVASKPGSVESTTIAPSGQRK